ncbi:hypothetical protein HYH03_006478 [Edaphochlamys debaryana]|uniref:Nucleotide-diphospho-sugar transferase domain-containing protein n=1 Tax=Edaphochlamys debaryana TaxID=47281 RepID=A0A836C0B1_9CHLO|nr:hypothetical protein HYH03_006478 [Edaphochlamys debaryana]|eukprot:KAG2495535.1 hypothetical protein HYH03_006478 [Edaphochlamys debaryana]
MPSAEDCSRLRHVFAAYDKRFAHFATQALGYNLGPISCGWYNKRNQREHFEFFGSSVFGHVLVWQKFYTTARAVALGYNVLCIDSDVLPLGDFYGYVKQPPASAYTMIAQAEVPAMLNSGFMYYQNASATGPTLWALYHFLERAVRWSEDTEALRAISASFTDHAGNFIDYQDQNLYTDVLWSAMTGHPQFQVLFQARLGEKNDAWPSLGFRHAGDYREEVWKAANRAWRTPSTLVGFPLVLKVWGDQVPGPGEPPRTDASVTNVTLWTAQLRIPHVSNPFAGALKKPVFGPPGANTQALRKAFTDLGVMPLNPENPAHAAAAAAAPPELLTLTGTDVADGKVLGAWIQHNWYGWGRHGWWHRHLKPPFEQAMGHVHAGLPASDTINVKKNMLITSGNWNWHLHAVLRHSFARVYAATAHHPEQAVHALARIVTYAPGVIHHGLTKEQFVRAAQQLARAAIALSSSVAWPTPHCSSDWVLTDEGRKLPKPINHTIPWVHLNTHFQVMPFGVSPDRLKCEWPAFMIDACLENEGPGSMRGLMGVELEHLLSTRGVSVDAAPDPKHVLRLQASPDPPPAAPSASFAPVSASALLQLNAAALLALPQWGSPVFLDRLVELTELPADKEAEYEAFRKKCRALHYFDLQKEHRTEWRRRRRRRRHTE